MKTHLGLCLVNNVSEDVGLAATAAKAIVLQIFVAKTKSSELLANFKSLLLGFRSSHDPAH